MAARIGRAQIRDPRTATAVLRREVRDHLLIDGGPARIQFDAQSPSGTPGDGRTKERAADTRKGVKDEFASRITSMAWSTEAMASARPIDSGPPGTVGRPTIRDQVQALRIATLPAIVIHATRRDDP